MKNNVLFVDDEIHILKAIKRGLYKEDYNMFFANSGNEALEILEQEEIHVIVSDMKMPKMTGLELLTIVKERYPKIIKIILSGYTQLQQIIVTINKIDIYKFITKPWDIEVEFKEVIRSAIDLYNTREENENLKKSIELKNGLYQKMLQTNNEKFMLMKKNLKFFVELNEKMNDFYYLIGVKLEEGIISREQYYNEIQFISESIELIIKKMPSEYSEFNFQTFVMKFKTNFHLFLSQMQTEFDALDLTDNKIFYGEYRLVLVVIERILNSYFVNDSVKGMDLVVSIKKGEDSKKIVFLFRINGGVTVNNIIRKESIEIIYNCLLNTMGGVFSIEEKNDQKLLILKIPVYCKLEESE